MHCRDFSVSLIYFLLSLSNSLSLFLSDQSIDRPLFRFFIASASKVKCTEGIADWARQMARSTPTHFYTRSACAHHHPQPIWLGCEENNETKPNWMSKRKQKSSALPISAFPLDFSPRVKWSKRYIRSMWQSLQYTTYIRVCIVSSWDKEEQAQR